MAIAYSGRMGTQSESSKTISVSGVAANSLLVAIVHGFKYGYGNNPLVTAMSHGGGTVPWSLARRIYYPATSSSHTHETTIWYRENSGSGTIAPTFTDVGIEDYIWNWAEFTGAALTGALDTSAGASNSGEGGASLATGSTGALAQADSLLIGGACAAYCTGFTGPGVGTSLINLNGAGDVYPPGPLGGIGAFFLPGATTAANWTFGWGGTAPQGSTAALAVFKGAAAATLKRIRVANCQASINGTTGWSVRHWQTDTDGSTFRKVGSADIVAASGALVISGSTVPNLTAGTPINVVAHRPGASPIDGMVGILAGVIEDY